MIKTILEKYTKGNKNSRGFCKKTDYYILVYFFEFIAIF